MKIRFTGGHDTHAFGTPFPDGEWVEVTDPAILEKLGTNRFFEAFPAVPPAAGRNTTAPGAPKRGPGRSKKVDA